MMSYCTLSCPLKRKMRNALPLSKAMSSMLVTFCVMPFWLYNQISMNYTINPKLIKDFREKVNEDFVFEKYKNVNGKNHWNIICSCMDWIDVAVSFIQDYGSDTKNIDVLSMDTYSYISSIDIIHEAVTQLHRVFIPNQSIPFKGKNIYSKITIYVVATMNISKRYELPSELTQ